jgi:hypothetical protein
VPRGLIGFARVLFAFVFALMTSGVAFATESDERACATEHAEHDEHSGDEDGIADECCPEESCAGSIHHCSCCASGFSTLTAAALVPYPHESGHLDRTTMRDRGPVAALARRIDRPPRA